MRCPRCGFQTTGDARTCARCGSALPAVGAAPQGTQAAANIGGRAQVGAPQHQAPQAAQNQQRTSGEAPPWAGTKDAAPWQTPPEYAVSRQRASAPAPDPAMGRIPDEPIRQGPAYPKGLGVLAMLGLVLAGLSSAVYGIYALTERRALFDKLADDPSSVSVAAATASDTVNLVLFLTGGVLVIGAAVLLGLWVTRYFQSQPQARLPFGMPWWVMTGVAALLIVVALFLHSGTDLQQIVIGYILLGIGSLLLALLSIGAIFGIRAAARHVEELANTPVPPRLI